MDVASDRIGARTRVSVRGDVDSETAPELERRLTALLHDGVTDLVIDLSEVAFLSSAGLSALITAHHASSSFRVERGNHVVDRLFMLTGLELLYGAEDVGNSGST